MRRVVSCLCVMVLGAGALSLPQVVLAARESAPQLSQMTKEQKEQEQKYFRAHSLGFARIFSRYHPGPYWILHHRKEFRLTAGQVQAETRLKLGMARSTIEGNRRLMAAYKVYATDAAAANPSLAKIHSDIEAVGRAQTWLAGEMVPYHLKSYALLMAQQKQIYHRLVLKRLRR